MTRIAYMGGEPMKHKCVIVVALSTFACFGGITTNSPLSLLRSKWGKGSIVDFRKVAYENLPLLFDEGVLLRLRKNAWNLKCATASLTRVVTNEFPRSVLPLLPESERDKIMSEVLERSGLKSSNEDEGGSSVSRCSQLTVVSVIVCSFVFCGCILYRRFKYRGPRVQAHA